MVKHQSSQTREHWVSIENATPEELVKEITDILRTRKVIDTVTFKGKVNGSVTMTDDDRKTLSKFVAQKVVGYLTENCLQETYNVGFYYVNGKNVFEIDLDIFD